MENNQNTQLQKPKNNLPLAIVGTVLFWPVALWGLLKAVKVNRLWNEGKHEEAIEASNSARKLGIVGIIVGGVLIILCLLSSVSSDYFLSGLYYEKVRVLRMFDSI
jgi:hypothetical protein